MEESLVAVVVVLQLPPPRPLLLLPLLVLGLFRINLASGDKIDISRERGVTQILTIEARLLDLNGKKF